MKAMILEGICDLATTLRPLRMAELPDPVPGPGQIRVRVSACGVCHTELDEIEGRTPPSILPMVPGHQVVGRVVETGAGVTGMAPGDRVGLAWIHSACGRCPQCRGGLENLCPDFKATGRDAFGGYAEQVVIGAEFAFAIPEAFTDSQAAPLLCAGAIGYRSLRLTGLTNGRILGLTGFGASAHLVLKMARHRFPDSPVFVFARSPGQQEFARDLGAAWAGGTGDDPPQPCDAVIDTTPAWKPVMAALACLAPGGRLVINAIRKEAADRAELQRLDYPAHLWMEKEIKSVANVARRDVAEFLDLAAAMDIRPEVQHYPLTDANRALMELRQRQIRGAKVLRIAD